MDKNFSWKYDTTKNQLTFCILTKHFYDFIFNIIPDRKYSSMFLYNDTTATTFVKWDQYKVLVYLPKTFEPDKWFAIQVPPIYPNNWQMIVKNLDYLSKQF